MGLIPQWKTRLQWDLATEDKNKFSNFIPWKLLLHTRMITMHRKLDCRLSSTIRGLAAYTKYGFCFGHRLKQRLCCMQHTTVGFFFAYYCKKIDKSFVLNLLDTSSQVFFL